MVRVGFAIGRGRELDDRAVGVELNADDSFQHQPVEDLSPAPRDGRQNHPAGTAELGTLLVDDAATGAPLRKQALLDEWRHALANLDLRSPAGLASGRTVGVQTATSVLLKGTG